MNGIAICCLWTLIFIVTVVSMAVIYVLMRHIIAEKRKNKYLDKAIHDLKTSITTINLAVDALPENEFSTIVKSECCRLNEIAINLHNSIIHGTIPKLELQIINIHNLINECLEIMKSIGTLYDCAINSSLVAKKFTVIGEKERLSSVFLNIMDNAIKYCDKSPEIEITTISNNKRIIISFKDNGVGVKRKYRRRVFHKSFRIRNKDDVEGFGMGLYYAKKIISEHKGKIIINNNPDGGTIFQISLPLYN